MPGSPRVERAANIRIQHPNLSTEDAMKLAGYDEDESKDPKRQSNVRQKTHRLTKGRKRSSIDFAPGPDVKRLPMDGDSHSMPPSRPAHTPPIGGDFFPFPIEYEQNRAQGFDTVSENLASSDAQAQYRTPAGSSPINGLHRAPGSARAEKAARFWLDNPNLSIENAMKLAGFNEEEVKDTYRQNDIRHTAHLVTVNSTKMKEKKTEIHMSSELRGLLTAIDRKVDEMSNRLQRTVDVKLSELGARIDDKFHYVNLQLSRMPTSSGPSSSAASYDQHTQGSAPPQQQQYSYQSSSYPSHRQSSHGYNMPPGQQPGAPGGGQMMQGGMGYARRPSMHPVQGRSAVPRNQDGNPRHGMDSTVQL